MSKSLFTLGATALSLVAAVQASYIEYSTVTGFFLQDVNTTVASTFSYSTTNFGLINQTYDTDAAFDPTGTKTQWERFENKVSVLQAADPTVDYKVLYLGRHGEGYHNVAETFYGTPAWNCYWAELDGNGTITWADAHITPNGAAQAQIANTFWASQISTQGQTLPQSFYTSPLTRCLETAQITWAGLTDISPTVKELFREGISQHTCDRRSNKTYIEENFPSYPIEAGFTEYDELWEGYAAETSAGQDVRSKTVLDEVFSSDDNTYLSITSHSGEIGSILRVLGHQTFSLSTGAVIPVLVKAQTIEDGPAVSSYVHFLAAATCTAPPITSLATGGCVCPTGTSVSSSTSPVSVSASVTSSASVIYTNSTTSAISYTTSTVRSTETITVTSCAASVTNCPTGPHVTTVIVDLYTTICPVTATETSNPTPSPTSYTTSTVRSTELITVTSCAASVTDCPAGPHVSTVIIDLYTTICPVTASETPAPAPVASTTSVVYTTKLITFTSCAATVTNCPAKSTGVITSVIPLYTTTYPVLTSSSSLASIPYPTGNSTSVHTSTPAGVATTSVKASVTSSKAAGSSTSSIATSTPSTVLASGAGKMGVSMALLVGAVVAGLWM